MVLCLLDGLQSVLKFRAAAGLQSRSGTLDIPVLEATPIAQCAAVEGVRQ
jgi:hypothetical protein